MKYKVNFFNPKTNKIDTCEVSAANQTMARIKFKEKMPEMEYISARAI